MIGYRRYLFTLKCTISLTKNRKSKKISKFFKNPKKYKICCKPNYFYGLDKLLFLFNNVVGQILLWPRELLFLYKSVVGPIPCMA